MAKRDFQEVVDDVARASSALAQARERAVNYRESERKFRALAETDERSEGALRDELSQLVQELAQLITDGPDDPNGGEGSGLDVAYDGR